MPKPLLTSVALLPPNDTRRSNRTQAAKAGTMNLIVQAYKAGVKRFSIASSITACTAGRAEKKSWTHEGARSIIFGLLYPLTLLGRNRLERYHRRRGINVGQGFTFRVSCCKSPGGEGGLGVCQSTPGSLPHHQYAHRYLHQAALEL